VSTAEAFDRLTTIVDEAFGLQPVAPSFDDLLTTLERLLFEQRRREASPAPVSDEALVERVAQAISHEYLDSDAGPIPWTAMARAAIAAMPPPQSPGVAPVESADALRARAGRVEEAGTFVPSAPASAPAYPAWDCLGCGLGYSRRCGHCRPRDPSERPFGYPEHAPPAVECDGWGWVARRRTPGTKLGMVFVEQEKCPGCPNCKSKERR